MMDFLLAHRIAAQVNLTTLRIKKMIKKWAGKKELLHTFQLSYKWQSSKEVLLSWFLEVISKGGKIEFGILWPPLQQREKNYFLHQEYFFFD